MDPWITNEILEAIKDKDRLLCNAKRSDSEADWIRARRRRNEVKTLVKHAKSNFLNERNIRTRLHDAPVFSTSKPNLEKYKANVFYKGAVLWNNLRPSIRNIETYLKPLKNNGL